MAAAVSTPMPNSTGRTPNSPAALTPHGGEQQTPRSPLFPDDARHQTPSAESEEGASNQLSQVTSPAPPYWSPGQSETPRFGGFNGSTESIARIGAIIMQDNEMAAGSGDETPERNSGRDRNRACWAKSVSVTDYVIVNGSATNIGAFVVWNIRVETLSGSYMNIRKRYSEFDDLRHKLTMTFPNFEAAVPVLPPKSVISKFRPKFLEKRRSGLQYFLNCILLNPEFSGSPVLKDFLFS